MFLFFFRLKHSTTVSLGTSPCDEIQPTAMEAHRRPPLSLVHGSFPCKQEDLFSLLEFPILFNRPCEVCANGPLVIRIRSRAWWATRYNLFQPSRKIEKVCAVLNHRADLDIWWRAAQLTRAFDGKLETICTERSLPSKPNGTTCECQRVHTVWFGLNILYPPYHEAWPIIFQL